MDLVTRFMEQYGRPPTEFDTDYLEMLRMTKYRILDQPDTKLAECGNCGCSKDDGRKYVDFGLQVEWHGCVFLCGKCLWDIAKAFGMFDKFETRIERLLAALLQLENEKTQGTAIRDDFLTVFKEVQDYFSNLKSVSDHIPVDQLPSVDVNTSEPSKPAVNSDKSETDGSESRTTESVTVTGPKNVPSLAELFSTQQ